jgi:hypothetical protein
MVMRSITSGENAALAKFFMAKPAARASHRSNVGKNWKFLDFVVVRLTTGSWR